MDNSSNIAFALIAGFVVYITVRGELPAYLCVIGIGSNCATPPPSNQSQSSPGNSVASASSNNGAANPPGNSGVNGTAIMTSPGWPGTIYDPFGTLPTLVYDSPVLPPPIQTSTDSTVVYEGTDSTIIYDAPGGEADSTLPSGGYDPYGPYQSYDPYAGLNT